MADDKTVNWSGRAGVPALLNTIFKEFCAWSIFIVTTVK